MWIKNPAQLRGKNSKESCAYILKKNIIHDHDEYWMIRGCWKERCLISLICLELWRTGGELLTSHIILLIYLQPIFHKYAWLRGLRYIIHNSKRAGYIMTAQIRLLKATEEKTRKVHSGHQKAWILLPFTRLKRVIQIPGPINEHNTSRRGR